MTKYRIELRTYNIGADRLPVPGTGVGAAHNFIAVVEVAPGQAPRVVAELHGDSYDRRSGKQIAFDATGRGQLEYRRIEMDSRRSLKYQDSLRHPSFILFEGSKAEVDERLKVADATGEWINGQRFRYSPLGTNSNSLAHTIARAMGFDVTGQPIDRATGRHIPAPGGSIDLTRGRSDAPAPFATKRERVFGYGDEGKKGPRPIPPEREAPPYDGPGPFVPKRSAVPATITPASFSLGFENARRFADDHGFDPRAEAQLSSAQNRIIAGWVERVLAPAVAHAQLPEGLAGDVLDHAAGTTPHEAGLMLQQGLNRLAGAAEFGKTPPAFAGGAAKRVTEDGWIGPETIAAAEKHAAEDGLARVRAAVALTGFERGLDGLAKGDVGAEEAPAVFRRSVGRLYRNPDGEAPGGFAPPRPGWASASQPHREEVATLQDALNDANRIFGFADQPLKVDGDLGPKTGAALVSAARAAGSERLTDHVAKRLGIGEPDLMDNPARGFGYALDDEEGRRVEDAYGGLA